MGSNKHQGPSVVALIGISWRTVSKSPFKHTFYTKIFTQGEFSIVCLYVDDLNFTENSSSLCEKFKIIMKREFEMTDMVILNYFLGIEVKQQDGIFISLKKYARDL